MSGDGLSPREHRDMRDVILAGTQHIRPAGGHRGRVVAAAVALLLVGGIAGGVIATAVRGPGVIAGPAPKTTVDQTAPAPEPEPKLSPDECDAVLTRWLVSADAVVGGQQSMDDVPDELGRYLPAEPDPTCVFASVDGDFVQEAWYVVRMDEEARRIDAQVRRAFEEDRGLHEEEVGVGEDAASYVEDIGSELAPRWSVRVEQDDFAVLVGLDPEYRIVRVARWQAEY